MLFALVPVAFVPAPICPRVDAVALLLVVQELTVVPDAILVEVDPPPVHEVVQPFTVVLASIRPDAC